jgi:glutathione peroxidase
LPIRFQNVLAIFFNINPDRDMPQSIYDFTIQSLGGKEIRLADFKDRVLLLVNTASKCGFTPQYQGLQKLYDNYKDQGLVIIGFPCNQFGGQEPGEAKDIEQGCLINYGVTFLMNEKIDVNGDNAHPIYEYIKDKAPGLLNTKAIKWNFTKFLIDRTGEKVTRYASQVEPQDIAKDIEELLK